MKLRSDAKLLKQKALISLLASLRAFNDFGDEGRVTTVLLRGEHAFEMLLKAALVQNYVQVFDVKTQKSITLDQAINRARDDRTIRLGEGEAGLIRVLAELRDAEQHWYVAVDEGVLYIHMRGLVTTFGDLLHRAFGEKLADHLPHRVMPIGTEPPRDFQFLVDREFANVAALLRPGRRAGTEARGRIAALLAMEAHADPDTNITKRDVNRVQKGIRDGKTRAQVFPKLAAVATSVSGEGVELQVRFVKKDGLAVTFVDDPGNLDVAAIRTVDLQKKYHRSTTALADALGLTQPRSLALRRHLGVDTNPSMAREFSLGAVQSIQYSDNAFNAMREALSWIDMDAIWRSHTANPSKRAKPRCLEPGCVVRPAGEASSPQAAIS